MDDRELIIDALRDYENKAERCAKLAKAESVETLTAEQELERHALAGTWRRRAEDALRVRAELEDNADYAVKGGGAE